MGHYKVRRGKVLPLLTMKPINSFIVSKSKAALSKEFFLQNEEAVVKIERNCHLIYVDNTLWNT